VIKELTSTANANIHITVDDTVGIEPGMVVTGLAFRGNGSINGSTSSNVITGTNTYFSSNLKIGSKLFYNGAMLGTVGNIVSNTSIRLLSNATANVANTVYDYINDVNSGNCIVLSTDGDSVTTSNTITANIGDRIVFNAMTRKLGPYEPWRNLVNVYGNLTNGSSQVRLEMTDGNEIIGTVAYNPVKDTSLLWSPDVDTLPVNTLPPVNAIIDPQSSRPNKDLQSLVNGTRYLLISDYVTAAGEQPAYNWNGVDNTLLVAYANDIIQFNGQHWAVVFDASNTVATNYVTNLTTGTQYRWNGSEWTKSYEGYYEAGKWQLVL
jgi:hypothetical protein